MGGNKKRFLSLVFLAAVGTMLFAQSVFGTSGAKKPSALEWYNKGKEEQDAQNWYSAIESYQEALRSNPSYGQAWLSLAECTYALGEYDLAISYADSAAEYLKNTTAIANLKGFALIGLARLDEARAVFDQVLARYPNDTDARFGLAELDIFVGKISGAESLYLDALKRQPESRKALLSLALVSYELGKTKAAKEYINQALKFHSDNPEVHYFAAYILAREGSWIEAEGRVRAAIQLKPGYDEAYSLLASILYSTMRYQSVVDICEYRISRDRKSTSAWYLKGLALTRLNRIEEAIAAYQSGLEIDPEDEIMRTAMEQLVCSYLDIEDSRRARWAQWHSKKAEEFSQKYQSLQARYEYKRALVLNPSSVASRLAFSEILLRDGYPENYLGQLRFIRDQGNESRAIEDKIESYSSLLEGSISNKWEVDPFYLDKTRYKIGLYYVQPSVQLVHPDSEQLTSQMLAETLSSDGRLKVSAYTSSISGYSEAFRLSRQGKQDYFGLVEFEENERELTISLTLYVARTGNKAAEFKVYRTGNSRYANALRRMSQIVAEALPKRAKIIGRNGSTALIDCGKTDGAAKDMVFNVIKKDKVVTQDKTLGAIFDEQDLFGTVTITNLSEEISEANIKQKGFYDRINVGDELLPVPETLEEKSKEVVPVDKQKPALITLIKSIK
ncbi:MAG: tetratricopeptide repeat protein [Spirochaetales bacterium]|nr:tetratricopeptide repeat protein [Spirochaetales bacterium]